MRIALITVVMALLCAGSGWAQSGLRNNYAGSRDRLNALNNRPTVSPYLGLIASDTATIDSLTGRYQSLVRPQFESRQNLARTQQSLRGLQTQLNQLQLNTALPAQATPLGFQSQGYSVTGHPSYFSTYSHYYPIGR